MVLLYVLAAPFVFVALFLWLCWWLAVGVVEYWRETQAARAPTAALPQPEPGGWAPRPRKRDPGSPD